MTFNYFVVALVILVVIIEDTEIPFCLTHCNRVNGVGKGRIGRALEAERQHECEVNKINDLYCIQVLIGNPKQRINLKISSLFQGIYIVPVKKNNNGFDRSLSKTFNFIGTHTNGFGNGDIITDAFELPALGININKFPFFLVNRPSFIHKDFAGLFGISYSEKDYSDANLQCSFDFFDYVDNYKRVYNIIGFKAISKDKGIMSFGELPSEIKHNMKLYKTCPITSNLGRHLWQCSLNGIYLDDGSFFKANAFVDFLIGGNTIEVSLEFFWFIYSKYFSQFPNCSVKPGKLNEIVCDLEFDTKRIGTISFIFGKWTLKIKGENLFIIDKGHFKFAITSEEYLRNWVISPSILLNQYIFLDGNNKRIGFYHS